MALHSGYPPDLGSDLKSQEFDQALELPSVWVVTTAFVVRHVTLGDADVVADLALRQASIDASTAQQGTEEREPSGLAHATARPLAS